jgi:hypothetical protein
LLLLLVLQRTAELIKDSSLWRSNFIPSVHDSFIIIGSGSYFFIPLVRVSIINVGSRSSIKSEFQLSWVYIPILLLGLNDISLRFASHPLRFDSLVAFCTTLGCSNFERTVFSSLLSSPPICLLVVLYSASCLSQPDPTK